MENVVKESEREKLKKEMDEDLEGKESIQNVDKVIKGNEESNIRLYMSKVNDIGGEEEEEEEVI